MYRKYRYVAIALLTVVCNVHTAPPVRVTIDCGSEERQSYGRLRSRPSQSSSHLSSHDVNSFCKIIHGAIPKAVKNGKFVLIEQDIDQTGFSDTQVPMSISPPEGIIPKLPPKLRRPKLKVSKLNVPKLRAQGNQCQTPKVGSSMSFLQRSPVNEDSSAERMELFKKGVQKLLHVVKVLGQIDQYLSERTRIIIDKLSKTFAD